MQGISSPLSHDKTVLLLTGSRPSPRITYGREQLGKALEAAGYRLTNVEWRSAPPGIHIIMIGTGDDPSIQQAGRQFKLSPAKTPGREGFAIRVKDRRALIAGADASGALYGCLELAERVRSSGALPEQLSFTDQPEMVLRGACVGIQKTAYLPGRHVYEYPYTPQEFPWLYDKQQWIQYLDMLAANRMNSLYLWNGHPFASLVRLKEYPYAVEVDSATFRRNEEMYRFLTEEADRRGIWVIQMFYNIILSKPFAEKHGLATQDRRRPITPLIADYTRKSIAAFVAKYPNVGLLVTLGEAMEGDGMDVEWFTNTIIPGVKDGLQALGKKDLPPIVLRGHDTNPQQVMAAARPLYPNLYTMNKYNGEALTTYTPRGPWAAMHRDLSRLAAAHIDNVHILANLEPFRYGATAFIQKCVQAMHTIHGANGLHLYPESSYWDWPYTADKATPRLRQTDRDRLWYMAWARYAWNCHRPRQEEDRYWSRLLDAQFGSKGAGKDILEAYEQAGEIAPKLLRRFGITNGNRQTLTLGMTMPQLINPDKYRVWPELYNSDGPEGETLLTYAAKEWQQRPHTGETPVQIAEEVTRHGELAVAAIERAAPAGRQAEAEFARLRNDMHCYRALARCFAAKAQAALLVLRYGYSQELQDLEKALPYLQQSVAHYRELANLTKDTYLYANSMQTGQRKVPVSGSGGHNKTWTELLPFYEAELHTFRQRLDSLKQADHRGPNGQPARQLRLQPAEVALQSPNGDHYQPATGQQPFTDTTLQVQAIAPALQPLQALRGSLQQQRSAGTTLRFHASRPVKVVVGFFKGGHKGYLQEPDLETDAGADNYGQATVRIANALIIKGLPPVNIHTYYFDAGQHTLALGKGACLILGFMDGRQEIPAYDAGLGAAGAQKLDWLFE
ncbi:hypothetical protein LX66_2360 [Chitinophaga japonensis]|uniref:Glycosyl hydrolase family 20 n=2 Tax=Chitinophaga japonensis TaxID=104662 RepID=A0A562T405_CHIJA|nr:hypothetical protein LX66_2360 [Chitinophaga japonensis]